MSWWGVQWAERLCVRGGWLWADAASMKLLLLLSRHAITKLLRCSHFHPLSHRRSRTVWRLLSS